MKPSPQSPEFPGIPKSQKPEAAAGGRKQGHPLLGISRDRAYKGGRVLPYAIRFRFWRETQGLSLGKIAARLEDRTREFGMDHQYLLTRLFELEQGRHKAPAWLILLLAEVYSIKFMWSEFLDGVA